MCRFIMALLHLVSGTGTPQRSWHTIRSYGLRQGGEEPKLENDGPSGRERGAGSYDKGAQVDQQGPSSTVRGVDGNPAREERRLAALRGEAAGAHLQAEHAVHGSAQQTARVRRPAKRCNRPRGDRQASHSSHLPGTVLHHAQRHGLVPRGKVQGEGYGTPAEPAAVRSTTERSGACSRKRLGFAGMGARAGDGAARAAPEPEAVQKNRTRAGRVGVSPTIHAAGVVWVASQAVDEGMAAEEGAEACPRPQGPRPLPPRTGQVPQAPPDARTGWQ
jgi:hypothetical protein